MNTFGYCFILLLLLQYRYFTELELDCNDDAFEYNLLNWVFVDKILSKILLARNSRMPKLAAGLSIADRTKFNDNKKLSNEITIPAIFHSKLRQYPL